jgi:hypothetical protein
VAISSDTAGGESIQLVSRGTEQEDSVPALWLTGGPVHNVRCVQLLQRLSQHANVPPRSTSPFQRSGMGSIDGALGSPISDGSTDQYMGRQLPAVIPGHGVVNVT